MDEIKNNIDFLRDELINDITHHDKTKLEEWENQKNDNKRIHSLLREMKISPKIQEKAEAMQPDIQQLLNERIRKDKRFRKVLKFTSVAASVIILLGMTGYFSYQQGFQQINSQMVEMINPLGMLSTVLLPDGSKVTLNAGSTISYPNTFVSKNRVVSMSGEAFFEVAHDVNHPFIVTVDDIKIEVLGTQFNVKSYENDDRIEVTLAEGKIGVRSENQKESSILNPGQQIYYSKPDKTFKTRQINITHYISWKEGKHYFRALPLNEIASQLERIFNVNIHIATPELQDIILTGDFVRGENLEQILRVLTADKRMKYRIEEDAIYIE